MAAAGQVGWPASMGTTSRLRQFGGDEFVCFYNRNQPFYEFTNFYPSDMVIEDGLRDSNEWSTVEHYFQAGKFPENAGRRDYIRKLHTARQAFEAARATQNVSLVRKDWHRMEDDPAFGVEAMPVKEQRMLQGLYGKFSQNRALKNLLMSTRGKRLVEDSPYDDYWGVGKYGSGQNRLGELLVLVRDNFDKLEYLQSRQETAPGSSWWPFGASGQYTRTEIASVLKGTNNDARAAAEFLASLS